MSAETFLKDYKAYFVDQELSEYDEQRIKQMFQQHSGCKVTEKIERVPVYIDRIVYLRQFGPPDELPQPPVKVDMDLIIKSADDVIENICAYWGVNHRRVVSASRSKYLVWCRFHCYHVLRYNGMTLPWIAERFNRDHTSIIHGIQQANNLIETKDDPFYSMYTTWWKAQGMPEVREEEAGEGVLCEEGEKEGGHSGLSVQPLHGVQEAESIVNVS